MAELATRCNSTFERIENIPSKTDRDQGRMFFTFPEDSRWNAERQAVEFGVEIGEYHGVVRRVFQRLLSETLTPERCVEALLPKAILLREHRRAEAAPAPIGRGRECRDHRARRGVLLALVCFRPLLGHSASRSERLFLCRFLDASNNEGLGTLS